MVINMSVSYNHIEKIIGPLIFLRNKHDVQYGEVVIIRTDDNQNRTGQVIKITEEMIVIEVFEDTTGISSENSKIIFTEESFKVNISTDMFGKTFNSFGKPIDVYTRRVLESDVVTNEQRDIYGSPINPFAREYPSDVIQTGISVIDGLFTLITFLISLMIFSKIFFPERAKASFSAPLLCKKILA